MVCKRIPREYFANVLSQMVCIILGEYNCEMLREHFLPLLYDQNCLGTAHGNASCFIATHIDLL